MRLRADLQRGRRWRAAETSEKAPESLETASAEEISTVEQAMIRGAVQAGKGKTESYSGRRHRAYSAAWDAARVELVGQAEVAR